MRKKLFTALVFLIIVTLAGLASERNERSRNLKNGYEDWTRSFFGISFSVVANMRNPTQCPDWINPLLGQETMKYSYYKYFTSKEVRIERLIKYSEVYNRGCNKI